MICLNMMEVGVSSRKASGQSQAKVRVDPCLALGVAADDAMHVDASPCIDTIEKAVSLQSLGHPMDSNALKTVRARSGILAFPSFENLMDSTCLPASQRQLRDFGIS